MSWLSNPTGLLFSISIALFVAKCVAEDLQFGDLIESQQELDRLDKNVSSATKIAREQLEWFTCEVSEVRKSGEQDTFMVLFR